MLRLGRPTLLFIMGNHPVLAEHVETNAKRKKKLDAFRERAKNISDHSSVHRVYAVFDSLAQFKEQIGPSIADLRDYLEKLSEENIDIASVAQPAEHDPIPRPPAFYYEPAYIGSHQFIGRRPSSRP